MLICNDQPFKICDVNIGTWGGDLLLEVVEWDLIFNVPNTAILLMLLGVVCLFIYGVVESYRQG